MPEIQLTPQLLNSEAGKMDTHRENLTGIVNQIQTLVNELQSGWHGKAQQAFVNSFTEKKKVYDTFAEDMLTFSTFMKNYAAAMENADASATSGLNF